MYIKAFIIINFVHIETSDQIKYLAGNVKLFITLIMKLKNESFRLIAGHIYMHLIQS